MLATALPQVVLRPLTVSDAHAYHDLLTSNRGHLTRHGNFVEETAWSLETVRSSLASCPNHAFGIWRLGVLLGRVDLVPVEPPKYGLGYLLASSATGQGVATESVRAVVGLGSGRPVGGSGVRRGDARELPERGRAGAARVLGGPGVRVVHAVPPLFHVKHRARGRNASAVGDLGGYPWARSVL